MENIRREEHIFAHINQTGKHLENLVSKINTLHAEANELLEDYQKQLAALRAIQMAKPKVANKYSIACETFQESFPTLGALIEAVKEAGQDPSYEVLYYGNPTGDLLWDYIK